MNESELTVHPRQLLNPHFHQPPLFLMKNSQKAKSLSLTTPTILLLPLAQPHLNVNTKFLLISPHSPSIEGLHLIRQEVLPSRTPRLSILIPGSEHLLQPVEFFPYVE